MLLATDQHDTAERFSRDVILFVDPPKSDKDLMALAYSLVFLSTALRSLQRLEEAEAAYERAILAVQDLHRKTGHAHPPTTPSSASTWICCKSIGSSIGLLRRSS